MTAPRGRLSVLLGPLLLKGPTCRRQPHPRGHAGDPIQHFRAGTKAAVPRASRYPGGDVGLEIHHDFTARDERRHAVLYVSEDGGACNMGQAEVGESESTTASIRFDLLEEVTRSDCVITLPKLKTHGLVRLTGATKILFGVVPGMLKIGYHTKLQTAAAFSEMLLDLLGLVKPRLAIMDAVVGMEGKGPSAGSPRQVGVIAASADSVALDVVCAHLVGLSAREYPLLAAAVHRGLSTGRLEDIVVLGEAVENLRVPDFKTPPGNPDVGMIPSVLPRRLRSWVTGELLERPVASPDRCTGCQTCLRSCPVQAISMEGTSGKKFAVMDAAICIRCYCCHELCPENAIDLKRGNLGRLLIH